MNTTPFSFLGLEIPRKILDKGSRAFLLRDSDETALGYEYITVSGSLYKGELLRGWYMARNEFGQYVFEVARHKNPLTEDDIRQIDAIGYMTAGESKFLVFEVAQGDLSRVSSDQYSQLTLDATNIRLTPELVV